MDIKYVWNVLLIYYKLNKVIDVQYVENINGLKKYKMNFNMMTKNIVFEILYHNISKILILYLDRLKMLVNYNFIF